MITSLKNRTWSCSAHQYVNYTLGHDMSMGCFTPQVEQYSIHWFKFGRRKWILRHDSTSLRGVGRKLSLSTYMIWSTFAYNCTLADNRDQRALDGCATRGRANSRWSIRIATRNKGRCDSNRKMSSKDIWLGYILDIQTSEYGRSALTKSPTDFLCSGLVNVSKRWMVSIVLEREIRTCPEHALLTLLQYPYCQLLHMFSSLATA